MLKLDNMSIWRRAEFILLLAIVSAIGYAAVTEVKLAVPPQCADYVNAVSHNETRTLIIFISALSAGAAACAANIVISIAIRALNESKKENKR